MRNLLSLLVISFVLFAGQTAGAHEFWISPERYSIDAGSPIIANLRVGEKLDGGKSSYLPSNFKRFDIIIGHETRPVTGRLGDIPALNSPAFAEGLAIIIHVTSYSTLRYSKWEKFRNFVTHKDLKGVLDRHAERGLPKEGFGEKFKRFGKSLIAVGHGIGKDREVGMEIEIIALANPYTDDMSPGLPVLVLDKGKPRTDVQIEVFAKDRSRKVSVSTLRTNKDGKAMIPLKPETEYLLDSVVMRELDPGTDGKAPAWESLWASLTFKTGQQLKR